MGCNGMGGLTFVNFNFIEASTEVEKLSRKLCNFTGCMSLQRSDNQFSDEVRNEAKIGSSV